MFDTMAIPDGATVSARARVTIHCPGVPQPVEDTPQLKVWRRHHGASGQAAIHPHLAHEPHDPAVLRTIRDALAPFADRACAIIYVTSGFPLHYRSPVLPHLLSALPPFASVIALRHDADTRLPQEARHLAEAAVRAGEVCLLVHDRTQRLVEAETAATGAGEVDFILLSPRLTAPSAVCSHVTDLIPEGNPQ